MAQIDAIRSAGPLHRPDMHRESHRVALAERNDFGTRLHPGPLFGEHEFTAGEITAGLRQQDRDLQRKYMLAVRS